ncbi:GDP-mannose transporter GONST1 [Histomonas meleagridis]|uniref:GDP-mannose transporter GONST1 n=1 Tax=Histomonas meleagridis TaxID=135588 RepID=UPI003559A352|nr:GDP-mannose transporter GONST1 [Histomonas meleagridis]KAH0802160.1 GDP-mannose transporter GONST1 [Histomonas meleagridis]
MKSNATRVAVLSVSYALFSMMMVFTNKLILRAGKSNPDIVSPDNLLIVQCSIAAVLFLVLGLFGCFPLRIGFMDLLVCCIVNFAFIGTMLANSYSLKYLSIHMVTLLKCLSVAFTAIGDHIFYKQEMPPSIRFSLFLIVAGSAVGAITDIDFSPIGYFWMLLSILFSTAYVLLTKLLVSSRNLHFFTLIFWNNFLSTISLLIYTNTRSYIKYQTFSNPFSVLFLDSESIYLKPWFIIFSGILGILVNFATFMLLGHASATSYVVVGAGKKVFQAILSFIIFPDSTNFANICSVVIGLTGSTMYGYVNWKKSIKNLEEENDENEIPFLADEENDCLENVHFPKVEEKSEKINDNENIV